jgi:hypothetical protein
VQSFSSLGIVKTEVSTGASRGRSTVIYLPGIPAHELEKELKTLLESKEALKNQGY